MAFFSLVYFDMELGKRGVVTILTLEWVLVSGHVVFNEDYGALYAHATLRAQVLLDLSFLTPFAEVTVCNFLALLDSTNSSILIVL